MEVRVRYPGIYHYSLDALDQTLIDTPNGGRIPLSELAADYTRYVASGEVNSEVADQAGRSAAVRAAFADRPGVTVDELDGLTVTGDGWWFNVRPSNTEPLLRLNIEAADADAVAALRDEVLAIVRA